MQDDSWDEKRRSARPGLSDPTQIKIRGVGPGGQEEEEEEKGDY
jgi:hypothetical protein